MATLALSMTSRSPMSSLVEPNHNEDSGRAAVLDRDQGIAPTIVARRPTSSAPRCLRAAGPSLDASLAA